MQTAWGPTYGVHPADQQSTYAAPRAGESLTSLVGASPARRAGVPAFFRLFLLPDRRGGRPCADGRARPRPLRLASAAPSALWQFSPASAALPYPPSYIAPPFPGPTRRGRRFPASCGRGGGRLCRRSRPASSGGAAGVAPILFPAGSRAAAPHAGSLRLRACDGRQRPSFPQHARCRTVQGGFP